MNKLILFSLMLCAFAAPVSAQEAAIDEMFRVMKMETQMTGGFEAMLPVVENMSAKLALNMEQEEELKDIFRTWFNEDFDKQKIVGEIKAVYTKSFSEEEIKEITRFYKTPVGKKFLELSPALMKEGARLGMLEGQQKQGKLRERIYPFLEKHGKK